MSFLESREYLDGESLCCGAKIDQQFHRCSDCGDHAEPVVIDADGIIRDVDVVNSLLQKDERPSFEPTVGEIVAGVALVIGMFTLALGLTIQEVGR
jgi:hypothetical protein